MLILCFSHALNSKELKRLGSLYPIEEPDVLAWIENQLKQYQASGKLKDLEKELEKRVRTYVQRPTPVKGIIKTVKARVFKYDPSMTVTEDLKDDKGQWFHRKGEKVNPLKTFTLEKPLVFINGDDPTQRDWLFEFERTKHTDATLILVKGAPFELMHTLKRPIYFDQGGWLVQKLNIQQVPAVVTQEQQHLLVQEIKID